jgi:hypothetical protein
MTDSVEINSPAKANSTGGAIFQAASRKARPDSTPAQPAERISACQRPCESGACWWMGGVAASWRQQDSHLHTLPQQEHWPWPQPDGAAAPVTAATRPPSTGTTISPVEAGAIAAANAQTKIGRRNLRIPTTPC